MVKVSKVAAWQIGDQYFTDLAQATAVLREQVIIELIREDEDTAILDCPENIARWIAGSFDKIESRVKAALAGA